MVNSAISEAMSASRIRLSAAARFSTVMFVLDGVLEPVLVGAELGPFCGDLFNGFVNCSMHQKYPCCRFGADVQQSCWPTVLAAATLKPLAVILPISTQDLPGVGANLRVILPSRRPEQRPR